MLANAFQALKTFDWGADLDALAPIEDAVIAAPGDGNTGQDLENRLIAALGGPLSRDAHDYICRKLAIVGTAAAVPALAALLGNKATSHMARYALERISDPEAGNALRAALGRVNGSLKIGVISSLGARRDSEAVALLGHTLQGDEPAVARAAALSLGAIGTVESATVLQNSLRAGSGDQQALVDALFACAEAMRNSDRQPDALAIYKSLCQEPQSRLVRLAATRGLLACDAKRG